MSQRLVIYTDGACKGNPGIGAYAAILMYGDTIKEVSGCVEHTTNNRMELMGVIEALKSLKRSCDIDIYTDSQYVKRGITEWVSAWKQKNYKNVKNPELWQELDRLVVGHNIEWYWVKGHSGDKYNDMVDALANKAISDHLGEE